MNAKTSNVLLIVVTILLTLNLVVSVAGWLLDPNEAQANIVAGKNWFTTSSPDGSTVYLWQYWTSSSVGPDSTGVVKYYGTIRAGGEFQGR